MKKFDVFLSHSSRDKPWATQLAASLEKQGLTVWLDQDQIRPGDDFMKAIERGISQCRVVVTVVDPKETSRGYQFLEAGMAIGLGKEISFVVPRKRKGSGLSVFNISKEKVVFRSSPAATAKQLIEMKKLTKDL
ncbi:MAG: toll/interleukin-1 receptor domain-containing protein [Blastocatellia bacterium]